MEELKVTKDIREAKEKRERGESPWPDHFKDLGPFDPKNPNIHALVYKPENYPGPIAQNATVRKNDL